MNFSSQCHKQGTDYPPTENLQATELREAKTVHLCKIEYDPVLENTNSD
jgi:hypothetical protein